MKVTRADINKVIRQVRDGKPPKLPKDTSEAHYWHPLLDGFGIRLFCTGRASWVQQYKRYGRTQKTTLGDVRILDEPVALKAARDLMAKIQLGMLDPQAAKAEARRTAKVKFEDVAERYRAAPRKTGLRASSARDLKLFFTGYYFQLFHRMPIDEITHEQITLQLQRIAERSGSQTAWKAYANLKAMFNWAFKHGLHPGPKGLPMARVEEPQKNPARTRILSPEEIRTIWLTCETWEAEAVKGIRTLSTRGNVTTRWGPPSIPDFPRAVMLLFLTGCRTDVVIKIAGENR